MSALPVARGGGSVLIEARDTRRTGELSGGEAQRVALARAMVGNPKVLLMAATLSDHDAPCGAV